MSRDNFVPIWIIIFIIIIIGNLIKKALELSKKGPSPPTHKPRDFTETQKPTAQKPKMTISDFLENIRQMAEGEPPKKPTRTPPFFEEKPSVPQPPPPPPPPPKIQPLQKPEPIPGEEIVERVVADRDVRDRLEKQKLEELEKKFEAKFEPLKPEERLKIKEFEPRIARKKRLGEIRVDEYYRKKAEGVSSIGALIEERLRTEPTAIREGIVLAEILGPPKALRRPGRRPLRGRIV